MGAQKNPQAAGGYRAGAIEISQRNDTRPADSLLPLLNGVQARKPREWQASCPTTAHPHGDRSRGLRITEKPDGQLLLWCPCGCTASEITGAVGLGIHDLFPRRPARPGAPPPFPWRAAFDSMVSDLWVVSLAAGDMARGLPFDPVDAAYLSATAARLASTLQEVLDERA